jgi:hypothetical protein
LGHLKHVQTAINYLPIYGSTIDGTATVARNMYNMFARSVEEIVVMYHSTKDGIVMLAGTT